MSNSNVKCPNCKEVFKVDDSVYSGIVKQVRDSEFSEELKQRIELANQEKLSAVKLAETNIKNALQEELTKKEKELTELKSMSRVQLAEELAKKDKELSELKAAGAGTQLQVTLPALPYPISTNNGRSIAMDIAL